MNVAALAHVGRHLAEDIADTCRTLQNVAALETEFSCNVPKGIDNIGRGVVCAVGTHHGLLVGFLTKQLAYFLVALTLFPVVASVTESGSKSAPTAELSEHTHLLGSGCFTALK